jgi:hypothetical protein
MLDKIAVSIFMAGSISMFMGFGLYSILKTDQSLTLGCVFLGVAMFGALLFLNPKE